MAPSENEKQVWARSSTYGRVASGIAQVVRVLGPASVPSFRRTPEFLDCRGLTRTRADTTRNNVRMPVAPRPGFLENPARDVSSGFLSGVSQEISARSALGSRALPVC